MDFEPKWMEVRWAVGAPERVLVLQYEGRDRARVWVPSIRTCQLCDAALLHELPAAAAPSPVDARGADRREVPALANALTAVLAHLHVGLRRPDAHTSIPVLLRLAEDFCATRYEPAPDFYRDVHTFNNVVVGPGVDRTSLGPNVPPPAELELGLKLVLEEVAELFEACGAVVTNEGPGVTLWWGGPKGSVRHVAALDAACDILYVLLGLLQRLGLTRAQLHAAWEEVTRANMAKADGPMRPDGKRLKPVGWTPPDLAPIVFPGAGGER